MAHNPLTTKYELNSEPEGGAVLSIYMSQSGLHQALLAQYPDTDFASIETNAYKKLAYQYIKDGTHLSVDGLEVRLGDGGIRLGSHQTDLMLFIENFPDEAAQLSVNIECFTENEGQHHVFWWNDGSLRRKVILSERNDFQASIGDARIAPTHHRNRSIYLLGVTVMIVGLLVYGLN